MAAIYKDIFTLLGTVQTQMSSARNAIRGLISSGFQCSQGVKLYKSYASSEAYMNKVQSAIINAYDSAITMAKNDGATKSVNRGAGITNLSYSLPASQKKSSTISLDYSLIDTQISSLNSSKNNLNEALSRCKTIISAVNSASYTEAKSTTASTLAGTVALSLASGAVSSAVSGLTSSNEKKKFQAAKESTLSYLKTAQTNLNSLIAALNLLSVNIQFTENAFKNADKTMEQLVMSLKESLKLSEIQNYISSGSATQDGLAEYKQELENLQAEYKAVYGKESEKINEAIAQINKELAPQLTTYADLVKAFGADMLEQHSDYYEKDGYSSMCMCVAYAVGLYIVTGKVYDPKTLTSNKASCDCDEGHISGKVSVSSSGQDAALLAIYNNLKEGKPVLIHSGNHWVTVVGIDESADVDNLSWSDLLVFNPTGKWVGPGNYDFTPSTNQIQNYTESSIDMYRLMY